jgi:hypothetical protein
MRKVSIASFLIRYGRPAIIISRVPRLTAFLSLLRELADAFADDNRNAASRVFVVMFFDVVADLESPAAGSVQRIRISQDTGYQLLS